MSSKPFDIVIIGSGLGGLLCGTILSKEGLRVCVIEKHFQIGGCLQNFMRGGTIFDTGVHYVGGLDEGHNLNQYFKYFGLIPGLKMKRLDNDCFDKISFPDNDYDHACGMDNFIDKLLPKFPKEKEALQAYVKKLQEINGNFPLYNLQEVKSNLVETSLYKYSATGFIRSITKDQRLQNVLAGSNLLYAGIPDVTPFYVHALINSSYIEGSWRFVGGSSQIATLLANSIEKNGGTISTNAEAVNFEFQGSSINTVELASGEKLAAKYFVSNIHPVETLKMIEYHKIREVYRNRINSLENTISIFIVYLVLKKNSFKYMNHNDYYYNNDNVWTTHTYSEKTWPESYLLVTPAMTQNDEYASNISVMVYMKYDEVKKWENTTVGKRGEDYLEFKRRKSEMVIDLVEKKYPDIRKNIQSYTSSTPLTYRDYTGTKNGSLYGIVRDCNEPMKTLILPKTKVPNLFLTGQNTNLHGVLGVTIGAVLTCSEIIGVNYLLKKIKETG